MLHALGEACTTRAAFARAGVMLLPRLIGADVTTLSVCDLDGGHRSVVADEPGAIPIHALAAFDHYFHDHPLVREHGRNPAAVTRRISDLVPQRKFRRTGLYNDYYREAHIAHAMAVPIHVDRRVLVSFVLNRSRRDFSDRTRDLAELLRPHLANFYRLVRRRVTIGAPIALGTNAVPLPLSSQGPRDFETRSRPSKPFHRRPAAILAADMVDYTRLMNENEEDTHRRVMAIRRHVVEPLVERCRGRIVKNTGDGFLAEFRDATNATCCAIAIQSALASAGSSEAASAPVGFRMGVHAGNVIIEPEDVYGNVVNLAARLEGLSPPGGIVVSAKVRNDVQYQLAARFVDLGDQYVKNVPGPVRAFLLNAFPFAAKPRRGFAHLMLADFLAS